MRNDGNLDRFVKAQETAYNTALKEIKNGRKQSHWMWYVFPQIQGLGFSETSRYYAIKDLNEATAFLQHPLLGQRLTAISEQLLNLPGSNAGRVFGSPDDMKLHSSMTLFSVIPGAAPVFEKVLQKYFNGKQDEATMRILTGQPH
jgi:uncharacterized protein (DUF1810 family)